MFEKMRVESGQETGKGSKIVHSYNSVETTAGFNPK